MLWDNLKTADFSQVSTLYHDQAMSHPEGIAGFKSLSKNFLDLLWEYPWLWAPWATRQKINIRVLKKKSPLEKYSYEEHTWNLTNTWWRCAMALAVPPWKYAWSPGLWLPPAVQPEDGQGAGTTQSRKSTGSQRAAQPGLAGLGHCPAAHPPAKISFQNYWDYFSFPPRRKPTAAVQ